MSSSRFPPKSNRDSVMIEHPNPTILAVILIFRYTDTMQLRPNRAPRSEGQISNDSAAHPTAPGVSKSHSGCATSTTFAGRCSARHFFASPEPSWNTSSEITLRSQQISRATHRSTRWPNSSHIYNAQTPADNQILAGWDYSAAMERLRDDSYLSRRNI